MQEMRKKRLIHEHEALVKERKHSAVKVLRTYKNAELPYTEIMPEGPDFCEFEPIKTILEQPTDVNVDESSFVEILPTLPDLIATWRKGINVQLARAMTNNNIRRMAGLSMVHAMMFYMGFNGGDDMDFDDDDSEYEGLTDDELAAKVKLATTVFRCSTCNNSSPLFWDEDRFSMSSDDGSTSRPLFYPEVLGHRCLTRLSDPLWTWDSRLEPIQRLDHSSSARRKWTARPLRLDPRVEKMVEAVLKVVGKDPATTTSEEMDNLGAWFACLKCAVTRSAQRGQTKAYGWRDVVGASTTPYVQ
jgi:hypothetical protein